MEDRRMTTSPAINSILTFTSHRRKHIKYSTHPEHQISPLLYAKTPTPAHEKPPALALALTLTPESLSLPAEMGIRFLSFHMLPYCFHLVYNHITCLNLPPSDKNPHHHSTPTIKLIRSDGHINIYHHPIPASLPMQQYPKHLICDSNSFFLGQRMPALSASDTLQLGHNYFLLPSHLFQSVLSFLTVASFASHHAFKRRKSPCRPFDVLKTASGSVQIRVSDEFIESMVCEEEGERPCSKDGEAGKLCSTPELEKDYRMLVGWKAFKDWKPKLEPIEEKERRKIGGFGMRKRKKSHAHESRGRKAL